MKKNFLFIANWKMYLSFNDEIEYITKKYNDFIKLSEKSNTEIIICPTIISLLKLSNFFKSTKINIGSQNCSSHINGSFTGQISAKSLNQLGIKYCIIGHSETRKYLHETNQEISQKFKLLINNKISPILCIGETEEDYKSNNVKKSLEKQLNEIFIILKNINITKNNIINIAYEPIWSIGTGSIADINHLNYIFAWLNEKISKLNLKIKINLLYGGSVNSKSVNFLKKINYLNGFLIGKASLDFQEFKKIVES